MVSTLVKWAADCNCQYVDRRGDWCKHIGGCFLSLRGVSRHARLLQSGQKRTPRKIVDYRPANARVVAPLRSYPAIQDTGAVRDMVPLAAVQDTTMAFNQLPMTQLRPATGLRPRRVEFDDATLSPERIKELKSRASRSVQERERRSMSRTKETVCPQAEVRPVEPEAPPAKEGNGSIGEVLEILDSIGSQEAVVRLVNGARKHALLLGFTYDRPEINDALLRAAVRDVTVKVALDRRTTLSGKPRDQQQMAQQLEANRIAVVLQHGAPLGPEYARVHRSVSGTGLLHAKCLLADDMLVVGSANWTTSSRGNMEVGALLRLYPSSTQAVMETLENRLVGAETLAAALETSHQRRGRSSSRRRVDVEEYED